MTNMKTTFGKATTVLKVIDFVLIKKFVSGKTLANVISVQTLVRICDTLDHIIQRHISLTHILVIRK